jgi:8-amino-7-oxononanoate synthase
VIDFTSALYLGLRHPSETLPPWRELTTGVPAALGEALAARDVAARLARLQGFAAGAVGPSTLHLAWDVFGLLSHHPVSLHMDAGAYAISRWGAARALLRGVRVREFRHHDVQALHAQLKNDDGATRPVVVTDGFCPACGRPAPLADYLAAVRDRDGWLVVDDTQALGILGWRERGAAPHRRFSRGESARCPPHRLVPTDRQNANEDRKGAESFDPNHTLERRSSLTPEPAYGHDGGGSFRWHDLHEPEIVAFASLAKAFGVPLGIVAGNARWIETFKRRSSTRVHCSPPCAATLSAARHALACNAARGGELRRVLEQRVRQFRRGLAAHGIATSGGLFPVQALAMDDSRSALQLHRRLLQRDIAAVPTRGEDRRPRLSFLITVRHDPDDIDEAVNTIASAFPRHGPARSFGRAPAFTPKTRSHHERVPHL